MGQRLRRNRSWWAAIAAGIMAAPALMGAGAAPGVAPSGDASDLVPPPELNPLETLPPDQAQAEAEQLLARAFRIADLVPEEYQSLVLATAHYRQVDPRLIAAVATVETHWKADMQGSHGELGLMQILPATGAYLAQEAGLAQHNLADPATSLDLGALYLSMLLEQYGTVEKALAAYNGGPRAVRNASSNIYVHKVLKVYGQDHTANTRLASFTIGAAS